MNAVIIAIWIGRKGQGQGSCWANSTEECFRKQWSDQDECMRRIVEPVKLLWEIQTSSQSDMKSWYYGGFSVHFRCFCWLKNFNLPAIQEGGVYSRRLYGKNFRGEFWLERRRNRIGFAHGLMEIFRFFAAILLILLILRISTSQRFRKERSVHDTCMGWFVEGIAGLNFVETHSDLHKDSWRY